MSFNENAERVRARLHRRVFAYRALFLVDPMKATRDYKWWQLGFWRAPKDGDLGAAADIVMRDLARYCYANNTTLTVSAVTRQSDAIGMAFAEGRRDVFNRIVSLMNLSEAQIQRIASRDD